MVPAFGAFRQPTIGHCIGGDRGANQQNPAKEEQRIAGRRDDVIENRTDDQSQTGAQGKRDRHSGDRNGGDQEQISEIENHSASEGFHQGASAGAGEIMEETHRSRRIRPAHGETEQKGARQNPPHVVPVEQLESPRFIDLLRVGPTAPAQHTDQHHHESDRVSVGSIHWSGQ